MKFLNCLFLIIGTAIGTGILALPLASPEMGFYPTLLSLIIAWGFMTLSAFMLLRTALTHRIGADLTSITKNNLGRSWQIFFSTSYLLLLYALLTVYILVGSTWLQELLTSLKLTDAKYQVIFTFICAIIIYLGVHFVGSLNQLLSAGVIITLMIVVILGIDATSIDNLTTITFKNFHQPLAIMITAFGFAVILPTLINYTKKDAFILNTSLITASLIILLLNILWIAICFGVIGNDELIKISKANNEGTEIIITLQNILNNSSIGLFAGYFAIFALLSSLIGVSLSLLHFIIDSFKLKKTKYYKINGIALTFTFPLLALLINPTSFLTILGFAGIFVAIILGILPAMLEIKNKRNNSLKEKSWKFLAYLSLVFYTIVILAEINKIYS